MEIEVVKLSANNVAKNTLVIPQGSTIAEVLQQGRICLEKDEVCGVFGELKSLDYVVQKDDRLEIYVPLLQDPRLKRMAKVHQSTLPRRCR